MQVRGPFRFAGEGLFASANNPKVNTAGNRWSQLCVALARGPVVITVSFTETTWTDPRRRGMTLLHQRAAGRR